MWCVSVATLVNWGRKFRPFRKTRQPYGLNWKRMKSPGFIQLEARRQFKWSERFSISLCADGRGWFFGPAFCRRNRCLRCILHILAFHHGAIHPAIAMSHPSHSHHFGQFLFLLRRQFGLHILDPLNMHHGSLCF